MGIWDTSPIRSTMSHVLWHDVTWRAKLNMAVIVSQNRNNGNAWRAKRKLVSGSKHWGRHFRGPGRYHPRKNNCRLYDDDDDFGFTSLYISFIMSDGNSSLIIIYIQLSTLAQWNNIVNVTGMHKHAQASLNTKTQIHTQKHRKQSHLATHAPQVIQHYSLRLCVYIKRSI